MSTFSRPFPVKQIQCLSDACYTFTSRTLGDLTAIAALSVPHDPTMRPACSWRSVFIDSAHTFWPVPHVELLLIIMARYHLNVLHWHPDPQLPPSHRRRSTSAPPGNRWARDLPPIRRRPRTPTPLRTRLLLRGRHPPPRHLRGGSRHSHHPRNLLPPTYRCPDPRLPHVQMPRSAPIPR